MSRTTDEHRSMAAVAERPLTFGSVCSGIEAASTAWMPLGWQPAWYAEIDKFPSKVLAYRHPEVPNLGNMLDIDADDSAVNEIDLLVGGTPCQAFSVAGLRKSLDDERGNLSLAFCRLSHRLAAHGRLKIVVWENVPGVLSTKDNAFGCFLAGLVGETVPLVSGDGARGRWTNAGCVYGPEGAAAWRTLDAQYVGLAQRRKRVFVVFCLGNWADPGQILFEWEGVRRDSPPSREAGKGTSRDVAPCLDASGCGFARTGDNRGQDPVVAMCLNGGGLGRIDAESETLLPAMIYSETGKGWWSEGVSSLRADPGGMPSHVVTHALKAEGHDASKDGTGRGVPLVPVAFAQNQRDEVRLMDAAGALAGEPGMKQQTYIMQERMESANPDAGPNGKGWSDTDIAFTLESRHRPQTVASPRWGVRRLLPVECERLQGFPDEYTNIPGAADGPRYRALGNSMAVPVMQWIGRRIIEAMT